MGWFLVVNMASGWLKNILIYVSRNRLFILIINWFWNWLKVSKPFSGRVGKSIIVVLSWIFIFVICLFLGWSLRVIDNLLWRWWRWYKFLPDGVDWVDWFGIWDNRTSEGVRVLVREFAGEISSICINILSFWG